jgi:hypothetical protein
LHIARRSFSLYLWLITIYLSPLLLRSL